MTRLLLPDGPVICKEPLGPGREERLQHEVAILQLLIGVPDVAQLAKTPAWPGLIFLEDVNGSPLTDMASPIAAPDLARLAWELARAVGALHRRGVMHRDISPANILLRRDNGDPYLIDFVLATSMAEFRPQFSHHNEIVGTLPYLAPEQTGRTSRPVDHRADLYALGATLYELATGAPPFGNQDPVRISQDHLTREPTPPAQANPAVPSALSEIIMRLLAKEPDSRYQSADELIHDLNDTVHGATAAVLQSGEQGFPVRPLSPPRLVGRDGEIAALAAAFDAARHGAPQRVLITGSSGVGKSALMNELRPIATTGNGWFVAGKFDQHHRDHGLDGVWQAFHNLARLLLAEADEELLDLRQRLRAALGAEANLVAAIEPEFGALLRVEPDRTVGDPLTLQNRLERAGVEILRAVASPHRPVIYALDDLQWAGQAALGFFDRVMQEDRIAGLLLVGSYRTTVGAHPLARMLPRWRQPAVGVRYIRLANLPRPVASILLAGMLRLDPDRAAELAALLAPRTKGNPYETVELIRSLTHDGLLRPSEGGWQWDGDILRIRLDHTDVATLLTERVTAMPAPEQLLIRSMACLGGRVDVGLLQAATGLSAPEVEHRLVRPLREGLLVMEPGRIQAVRFRHDSVQEAILRRMGRRRERELRLSLARRLADRPDLFTVAADQYLPVTDEVRQPQERALAVSMLRRAADQAELSSNFAAVDRYLAAAADLSSPSDTPTWVEVQTRRHSALYNLGRLDEADEVYYRLEQLPTSAMQRADATLVQVSSLTNRNRQQEAVQLGLELLRHLGCPTPARDQLDAAVDHGLDELCHWIERGEDPEDLSRPEITEAGQLAIGKAINRLTPPAYLHDGSVHAWLVMQAWRLWHDHGPARTLVWPISQVAVVIMEGHYNVRSGYRIARWFEAASAARGYELEAAQCRFVRATVGWSVEALEEGLRLAREARDGLIRRGELQTACFTYDTTVANLLECAPSLDHVITEVEAALAFARRTGSDYAAEFFGVFQGLADQLQGRDRRPDIVAPERYRTNRPAMAALHVARSLAAAILGGQADLAAHTAAAMPLLPAIPGNYLTAVAHVLRALALAEQVRTRPQREREPQLRELDQMIERVAAIAADAPDNFLHLLRMLEAERAWSVDDFRAASATFDAATREAATRQRPWHRALIQERAARFYLAHAMEYTAHPLLAAARRSYLDWGATAKVDQLGWAHPARGIASAALTDADQHTASATGRSLLTHGTVDLLSILTASQALSSETSIGGLHSRVSDTLSAMTGATGVHLLLWNDNESTWLVTSPQGGEGSNMTVLDQAGQERLVPVSVIRYLERTTEPLIIHDATHDDRFSRDPYLSGLERCSLLGVPIRTRGAVHALLLLENRLMRGAFAADRLDAVVLIAGQLAVSLNNVVLYTSLEQKVAARTEELAQANKRLERLSVTDSLTGLANRRHLERALVNDWGRARRASEPIAVAMVDIDDFKHYNDRYGHAAGDRCLRHVSRLLRDHTREVDTVARYGGDEFAIVMPEADFDAALATAGRLHAAVIALGEPHQASGAGIVTVSIGVAALVPTASSRMEHLTGQADANLYLAKRQGRNRVVPTHPGAAG